MKYVCIITICLLFQYTFAQQALDVRTLRQISTQSDAQTVYSFVKTGDYQVTDDYMSRGRRYVYLQQMHQQIPVENHISRIVFEQDRLLFTGEDFKRFEAELPTEAQVIRPEQAVSQAAMAKSLPYPVLSDKQVVYNDLGRAIQCVYPNSNLSKEPVIASLVWYRHEEQYHLCWKTEIYTLDYQHWWVSYVSANNGRVLHTIDRVIHCSFGHTDEQHQHTSLCKSSSHELSNEKPTTALAFPLAGYEVFDMPVESPNHGMRTLANDPWLRAGAGNPVAALNWHDDGSNSYTTTRGNNVYAYEDTQNNNSPGYSPNSPTLTFTYPYDQLAPPVDNQDASITNLFFWNNLMHDVMYQYGFDEPSGNFQENNLGRGGAGSDPVNAEAMDGSGNNNANFSTPPDGSNPRMQMYIWNSVQRMPDFDVNTPGSIAGPMDCAESNFSTNNKLIDVGPVTGNLVLVDDGVGEITDACESLQNGGSIIGNIALIDRGGCNFTIKVKEAQDHGAIAAVIINNVSGDPPFAMGGSDNSITIPAVMIGYADGQILINELANNPVNITMTGYSGYTPDSDFDNGIICHEYGHGVSIRLTGGPSSSCLQNEEQMGEGWSDYFALMLTTDWTAAQGGDRRGIGTYVVGQFPSGNGIRSHPYSTDMSINPHTYDDIKTESVPHGVGSVWCAMLWDMTWALIDMEGLSTDLYNGNGGNNIALNLVTEALKLQPCSPGFTDGRNAIIEADELLYNGDHVCLIWEVFANRGLGFHASQNSTNSKSDGIEDFSMPDEVVIQKTANTDTLRSRDTITYYFEVTSFCESRSNIVITDTLPDDYEYVSSSGGSHSDGVVTFGPFSLPELSNSVQWCRAVKKYSVYADESFVFNDDVESGNNNWTIDRAIPAPGGNPGVNWSIVDTSANSPVHAWFVPDNDFQTDLYLISDPLDLTQISELVLSFEHRYNTEATWDGGVVEVSTNGIDWTDVESMFIANGYNSTIQTNPASAISGRAAFTGNSGGFISSIVDLSTYASATQFQVRFRFAADEFVGVEGWYVDDIRIGNFALDTNIAYVAIDSNEVDHSLLTTKIYCAPPERVIDTVQPAVGHFVADYQCADDKGWTHYYDTRRTGTPTDDRLLLSIYKNGQDIGTIGDGVFEVSVHLEPDYGEKRAIDLSTVPYVSDVGADAWYVSNRWWKVTPNAGGPAGQLQAPVQVRFYFTDRDRQDINASLMANGFDTLSDASDFQLYKVNAADPSPTLSTHNPLVLGSDFLKFDFDGNPSDSTWSTSLPADVQFSVYGTAAIAEFTATSFSGGGVGAFASARSLPVELVNFSVTPSNCENVIRWVTASELQCKRFILQRSLDGEHFTDIFTVDCAELSNRLKEYTFTDENLTYSEAYYRLAQLDTDGSVHYSPISYAYHPCSQSHWRLGPNPADDDLYLFWDGLGESPTPKRIVLINAMGQAVSMMTEPIGGSHYLLDVRSLAAGVYSLQVHQSNGIIWTQRLIVQ